MNRTPTAARRPIPMEPLNQSAAALSGPFAPTYRFENLEIHKVFLRFPNLNLEQNPSLTTLAIESEVPYNGQTELLTTSTNAAGRQTTYEYYLSSGRAKSTYQSGVAAIGYTYSGGRLSQLDRKTYRSGAAQHQYYKQENSDALGGFQRCARAIFSFWSTVSMSS